MNTGEHEPPTYAAAAAIDALLDQDDGQLLASMAYYKASLVTMFGRAGIIELLRAAVDAAPHVDYFTRRSRREIDLARPAVNLRVDDAGALAFDPQLDPTPSRGPLGLGATDAEHDRILQFKTAVLYTEVCVPMADEMNKALRQHWDKARDYLVARGLDQTAARMLLTNMFVVRVARGPTVPSQDKMCVLGLLV